MLQADRRECRSSGLCGLHRATKDFGKAVPERPSGTRTEILKSGLTPFFDDVRERQYTYDVPFVGLQNERVRSVFGQFPPLESVDSLGRCLSVLMQSRYGTGDTFEVSLLSKPRVLLAHDDFCCETQVVTNENSGPATKADGKRFVCGVTHSTDSVIPSVTLVARSRTPKKR